MSILTNRKKKDPVKKENPAKAYNDKQRKAGTDKRTVEIIPKRNDGLTTQQRIEKQRVERAGGVWKKGATYRDTRKRRHGN